MAQVLVLVQRQHRRPTRSRDRLTDRRPFEPDDYWRLRQISDLQSSGHGRLAFVVRSVSREDNERRAQVWLAADDGTGLFRLGDSLASDDQPRWSPDGSRLTIAAQGPDGERRLWLVDAATHERRAIAHAGAAPRGVAWSPAGDRLCFVADVRATDLDVDAETRWYAAHPHATRTAPLVRLRSRRARVDGLGYRTRRAQLFVGALDAGTDPRRLTDGDFDDADPVWSPDGRHIAFVSNRSLERRAIVERNVWLVDVASGAVRQLTHGMWLDGPLSWSPDGTSIACVGLAGLHVPLALRLWLVSIDGGALAVSDGFGAHVWPLGTPIWTASGQRVMIAGGLGGTGRLVAYDRRSATTSVLFEAAAVFGSVQVHADGESFVALAATPESPSALVAASLSGGAFTTLVDVNADWLAEVAIAPTRPVSFTSPDGFEIGGWLVTPAAADGPSPCVVDVHYGPNAAWGPGFALGAQLFAARGIATLLLNPRGSTGYGDAFAAAADYGGNDFDDLLLGIDGLIAQGHIDATRLGIMGLSYGGFMANWAITRTSRFRAAVSINGIANQLTWSLLSDTGMVFYRDLFGDPLSDEAARAAYWAHSPLANVARVATPLLLVHSEFDQRCPIAEAEQFFGALVALGQTVELLRVPTGAHDLMGTAAPLHADLVQRAVLEWFERHGLLPGSIG